MGVVTRVNEPNVDEDLFGEDWKEMIAPYMQEDVGVVVPAEAYRECFGRPFRTMRTLAGLSVVECARLLGWTVEEIAAAEERSDAIGTIHFSKVAQAMATLGYAVARQCDQSYANRVWDRVTGDETQVEPVGDYVRFYAEAWSGRLM